MHPFQDFAFHRLTELPAPAEPGRDEEGRPAARGLSALLAALAGAHGTLLAGGGPGAAILTAWVRPSRGGPLRFLVGGRPSFPPAGEPAEPGQPRRLLFPPGALGHDEPTDEVAGLLASLDHWVACAGRPDALWLPKEAPEPVRRGSFDQYAARLPGPFAWLVLARPMRPDEVAPELALLVNEILPLSRGEVSESKRVGLLRKQARHRELSRAQAGGCWQVQVLVGAGRPGAAARAAGMLAAAADLDGLPYTLSVAGPPEPLAAAAGAGGFTATTELLVALARPPAREVPGLRLVRPHQFDVTPEPPDGGGDGGGGLVLGEVLDDARAPVGPLVLDAGSLNRHAFVCGATGAGKSQTVRHLLTQASAGGLPWLAVEPAKAEYARMANRLRPLGAEVVVIKPGDPEVAPAGINPLEPERGFSLQTHADLLRALFLAAFEAQEPFPQILAEALTRCYQEQGWDLALGEPTRAGEPRYPTLGDLQRVADQIVTEIGYGREVADNVRGFIKVRLGSLRLGTTGRFFEGGHPIRFGELRARNVVLEIQDVGDDVDKAFFMGVVLMRLYEHLRVGHGDDDPPLGHLTVIEEAHRLLRRPEAGAAGPAAHAIEMFAALLAEVRAYGEGLIIAEQIPSKLVPDVIKNTAIKIVHRLPARDDRDTVGATMNLAPAQNHQLVPLPRGTAAVSTDTTDNPLLVRVPDTTRTEAGPRAPLASVAALVGRRSTTCGRDCAATPCTLRQMRSAERLLTAQQWLTGWVELVVLAHLTGDRTPVARPELRALLTQPGVGARLVDCAVSHAVDDAVDVRAASLPPWTSARALAEHMCEAVRHMISDGTHACQFDELRYLATPFRWRSVWQALDADTASPGRHPASAEWELRYQRPVPGATRAEQLAAVRAFLAEDWADTRSREAATYGARRPSTLEGLVGPPDGGRRQRVGAVLTQFEDGAWAAAHLVPDQPTT